MKKNYQLKYVSEEVWDNTPKEIQEKKMKYSNLNGLIKRREGKIERLRREIKNTQEQLKDNKKQRTVLLEELQEFSENFIPSVSPYQSVYNNNQWSVNLKIGNIKKSPYLGSDGNVRKRIDEVKDMSIFYQSMDNIGGRDLKDELTEIIRNILQKNISKELEKDFKGVQKKLKENKLKMMDFLY